MLLPRPLPGRSILSSWMPDGAAGVSASAETETVAIGTTVSMAVVAIRTSVRRARGWVEFIGVLVRLSPPGVRNIRGVGHCTGAL